MKRFLIPLLVLTLTAFACNEKKDGEQKEAKKQDSIKVVDPLAGVVVPEETPEFIKKLSWFMAWDVLGAEMSDRFNKPDYDMFIKGFTEAYYGKQFSYRQEEIQAAYEETQRRMKEWYSTKDPKDTLSKPPKLPKELEVKISWSYGRDIGDRIKKENMNIDIELFKKAVKAIISGEKPPYSKEELLEMKKILPAMMRKKMEQQKLELKKIGEINKKEHSEWLAKNKANTDVKTTPSGLQYIVLQEGKGPLPKEDETVQIHMKGKVLNGEEFDNTYKKGTPATVVLAQALPAIKQTVLMAKVGSKFKVWAPQELCFKEIGFPPNIPPFSALELEIEVLKILGKSKELQGDQRDPAPKLPMKK